MSNPERVDVLKKLRYTLKVHWDNLGLPFATDRYIYNELKTLTDRAEKLRSAKGNESENEQWKKRQKSLFGIEFDITERPSRQRIDSFGRRSRGGHLILKPF